MNALLHDQRHSRCIATTAPAKAAVPSRSHPLKSLHCKRPRLDLRPFHSCPTSRRCSGTASSMLWARRSEVGWTEHHLRYLQSATSSLAPSTNLAQRNNRWTLLAGRLLWISG